MKGLSETLCTIFFIIDVAGMPGVGKTLTVTSVIDSLRSNPAYRKKFKPYYLNAMSFKHPSKIYKSLLYKIFKIKNVSRSKQVVRLGMFHLIQIIFLQHLQIPKSKSLSSTNLIFC